MQDSTLMRQQIIEMRQANSEAKVVYMSIKNHHTGGRPPGTYTDFPQEYEWREVTFTETSVKITYTDGTVSFYEDPN